MKALWLENGRLFFREDMPEPELVADEAIVRVRLAGICATDLGLINGYYPFTGILGHEFVGEIVAVANMAQQHRIGERVVGEINVNCGSCANCLSANLTHCQQRTVLGIKNRNGAFAEYLSLPLKNLIPIPNTISDQKAVFTEPLAAALEIQAQIAIKASHKVLIIGAGRLGQLIAYTLALTGCHLAVVARYEKQRQLLSQHHINWLDEHTILTPEFDFVIEATGSENGFKLALKAIRPRGTIILKSTFKDEISINMANLVVNEITLLGSRCGDFLPALRLLENRLINPTYLVDETFHFNEVLPAFKRVQQPGTLKILLRF
ncbi:MAG: alcohol dehydrogenase catalytic domain-containing protein [Thiomargarita sp.]|nr:alcohol dehydrogenase catalytic domain-containing protein [Thiomargarita sp.]